MSKIIGYVLLADLGKIKVFTIQQTEQKTVSLQAYQSIESIEGHGKLSEIYSDKSGDYNNSTAGGSSSYETKSDLERTNRVVDGLAEFINQFAEQNKEKLYLSLSSPIHAQVEKKLKTSTTEKIKAFLTKDLTKQNVDTVMQAFAL
ncbi:host attachment protein [Thiomicrorhabdus sediminis]|nr:host attachment protein [Thiomicrorhabdus sediminis]